MNPITFTIVPMMISYIVSFVLAIFVYGQSPKSGLHRVFSARCMLIAFWAILDFVCVMTRDPELRLFWAKCGFFWPIYIAVLFHFSLEYIEKTGSRSGKISMLITYATATFFSIAELALNSIEPGSISQIHWLMHYTAQGWAWFYAIENAWMVAVVGATVVIQTRYFVAIPDKKKNHKVFIYYGSVFTTVLSAVTVLLSGRVDPEYMYLSHFIPIVGNMIITYGIIRHELFIINPAIASENIISAMSDALFLVDTERSIIEVNRSAELLTGYAMHELRNRAMSTLFDNEHGFNEIVDLVLHSREKIRSTDIKLIKKDKSILDVSFSASVLRYRSNEVIGIVCLIRDISEQLKLLNDKASMDERLVQFQKMQAIGQLAGGIAHDFNNCLAAILLSAQELKDRIGEEKSDLVELVVNILDASKYGRDITGRLLSFARREQGVQEAVDVHAIIEQVIAFLSHTIDKKITITKDLANIPSTLVGNSLQLQNAFINIALNGCDAMKEKSGELVFRTGIINLENTELYSSRGRIKSGRFISVSIIDNGTGMDESVKKRLFEPFFTTKPVGKGTGLGLSSVYQIVQNHEGIIDVASIPDRGTTFTVYLPLNIFDIRQ
jgi:PAS domain S-box-containing protein